MKKILVPILLVLLSINLVKAQNKDIKDLYFEYSQTRMDEAKNTSTVESALALLQRSAELNDKQIANVSFHLARIYESQGKPQDAIPHYERAIKLAPGYYVSYRALGFIELKKCDTLGRKVSESAKLKDAVLNGKSYTAYKIQALKTISYFEKAEACDPDERLMKIISSLYTSIKNPEGLTSLPARLAMLGKDCVTLLDDE